MNNLYIETKDFKIEIIGSDTSVLQIRFVNTIKTSHTNNYLNYVSQQIIKYYQGELEHFDINFDFSNCTNFQKKIYLALFNSDYGVLLTYKTLANKINSKAYQATGSAMAKNPFVVVIPCHRVINNNYNLGNYSGPTNLKAKLTCLELNKFVYKYKYTEELNQQVLNNVKSNYILHEDKISLYYSHFTYSISRVIYQHSDYTTASFIEMHLYDALHYNITAASMNTLTSTILKGSLTFR